MVNKLTLSDIFQTIDNHFESETNLMYLCNYNLAEQICEYLSDNYDVYDEDMGLSEDIDEYYITLMFHKDDVQLFCESARNKNGKYKYVELDDTDYFFCVDIDEDLVNEYFVGDNCTWSWVGLKDEEELEEYKWEQECQCDECRKKRFYQLLADTLNAIQDADECPDCTMQVLLDYTMVFQDLGFRLAKRF